MRLDGFVVYSKLVVVEVRDMRVRRDKVIVVR